MGGWSGRLFFVRFLNAETYIRRASAESLVASFARAAATSLVGFDELHFFFDTQGRRLIPTVFWNASFIFSRRSMFAENERPAGA